MLNVLSFTYLHPEMVFRASQVLTLGPEAIDQLSDRYVLLSHESNPYAHDCPIHEIMYQDFIDYKHSDIPLERLKEIEAIHDPKDFNRVFPKDDTEIKRKVLNTINFAIDKVYKCEKLLVLFSQRLKSSPPTQGVPNAIYHVLQENFDIISMDCTSGLYNIIIQKRSEATDGSNASRAVH